MEAASAFGGIACWNRHPGARGDNEAYGYEPFLEETNDRLSFAGPQDILDMSGHLGRAIAAETAFDVEAAKKSWQASELLVGSVYQLLHGKRST